MSLEMAVVRQEITHWRDRYIIGAGTLLNSKAIEAKAAFETQLDQATLVDSLWDPAGFANARIDELMQQIAGPALTKFLDEAGRDLGSLEARLEPIGVALGRAEGLTLPTAPKPSAPESISAPDRSPTGEGVPPGWLSRVSARVADGATSLFEQAAGAAESLLQDKVGLRNRLRAAAAERIGSQWMGSVGDPKPVLAQLVWLIDEAYHAARTETL